MFINILLKREIRKVNKKDVPASHFVCVSLFKGRLIGIKKGFTNLIVKPFYYNDKYPRCVLI